MSQDGGERPAFRSSRKNSDPQNARIEHEEALWHVMVAQMKGDTEMIKQLSGT